MAKDEVGFNRIAIETVDGDKEIHIVGIDVHPAIAGLDAPVNSLALGEFGMSRKKGSDPFAWSVDPLSTTERIDEYLDRHYANRLTPMSSTLPYLVDYLSLTFTPLHNAQYRISTSYIWDMSSTSHDFRAVLEVNGVACWEHRQEPKDVNSQSVIQAYPDLVLPLLIRPNTVALRFMTEKKGKSATIKSAGITVERWNI